MLRQLAHLQSGLAQGLAHTLQQHWRFGWQQVLVLQPSPQSATPLNSSAIARIPIVFILTPLVLSVPEMTVGLSVPSRLDPHRAGAGKLLLDQCGVTPLLFRRQQRADTQDVIKRRLLRISLCGAHPLAALGRLGRIRQRLREISARRAVRGARIRQTFPKIRFKFGHRGRLRVSQFQLTAEPAGVVEFEWS